MECGQTFDQLVSSTPHLKWRLGRTKRETGRRRGCLTMGCGGGTRPRPLLAQNAKISLKASAMTGDLESCLSQPAINAFLSTNTSILQFVCPSARFFTIYQSARVSLAVMGSSLCCHPIIPLFQTPVYHLQVRILPSQDWTHLRTFGFAHDIQTSKAYNRSSNKGNGSEEFPYEVLRT